MSTHPFDTNQNHDDNLADSLRLRREVHKHGPLPALDQNTRDLRADQPRSDHPMSSFFL